MKKVLQFETYQHNHISRYLDKILTSILNESTCKVKYVKNNQKKVTIFNFSKFPLSLVNGMLLE